MSKITKIQIDDFRIYNGSQEFSFSNAGLLSNLMVIYAPNGYGKTSFFDAVEWCYASKIRRFETDVLGHEIDRRDYSSGDKILLTNRQSFKDGRSGYVKICTEDNKVIERKASERKGNKVGYKYDYRTVSNLNSDYSQAILEKLVKTNILTQDQIDEFLRHTKPDERFVQLQNFWPEGESAISILRDIDSYLKMLSMEKQELKQSIANAEKQIKEFLNAEDQITPLNILIKNLVQKSKTGFKLEELSTNVNNETYQVALTTTQTYIERAKIFEQRANQQIDTLINLKNDLANYFQWVKNDVLLSNNLIQLSDIEKIYTDLKSRNDSLNLIDSKLTTILYSQKKYERLLILLEDAQNVYKNIIAQKNTIIKCRQEVDKHFQILEEKRTSAIKVKSTLANWYLQAKELDNHLTSWDTEFENYKFWKIEQEKTSKKLHESKDSFALKEVQLNSKISRKNSLQSILDNGNFEMLPEGDVEILSEELILRNKLLTKIITTNNKIEKLKLDLIKSSSLDESLQRLLAWGEDYVKNTDANHCPLCTTKFNDVTFLIAKIQEQKSESPETLSLKIRLDKASEDEKKITEELRVPNDKIVAFILKALDICQGEISELQNQRDQISSEISNLENGLQFSTRAISQSLSVLNMELNENDNRKDFNFEEIRSRVNYKIIETKERCTRLENIIQYKNDMVSILENTISIFKNQAFTAENNVAILQAEPKLVETQQILNELELQIDKCTNDFLKNRISALVEEQTKIKIDKQTNVDHIAILQNQLILSSVQVLEVEIPGLRVAKQVEIKENEQKILAYKSVFKQFSETLEPTNDFFLQRLPELQKYYDDIKIEVEELEELSIQLKVIKKNVLKNSLEQEIIKWKKSIEPLDVALRKIKEARVTSQNYINNEINNYFNQDVINQIYSRIEPHPNLTHIKISPKVTDKGPILDIKAVSNDEELDPSLYLSAGQLNVLSLSIFLANAFETQNDEIDTIFMDDPIQNLSDINILSFIDLIRTMITKYDRQIVISSHDENFYKLMRNKMPSDAYNVQYYEIESFGKAKLVH